MAKEPLGITFDVLSDQEAIGVYEDENGVDVFETDAPYLLSDGKSLEAPLPVRVVDGPVFPDSMGNAQSAFPVNGLTPPQEWDPTDLFANGEPGFVLPVDPQFLFQNAAGTIPVTAPGQPVGLRLDVSRMQGKSLVQVIAAATPVFSADFTSGITGWTEVNGSVLSYVGEKLRVTPKVGNNYGVANGPSFATVVGRTYHLSLEISPTVATSASVQVTGNGNILPPANRSGTSTAFFVATATSSTVTLVVNNSVGAAVDFDNVSVKEIPGNHFIQTTAAARPTYQIDGNGKPCLVYDGSDDFMVSARNVDFSATDEMLVCTGLHKASDAVVGLVTELSADIGSNNGAFYVSAPDSNIAPVLGFASKGTTAAKALWNNAAAAAPVTALVTGLAKIGAPFARIRTNGVQRAQNTNSQGTGNYGNYPVYLGRRGGSSIPFNGRDYGIIARGLLPTDDELARVEAYYARAASITL